MSKFANVAIKCDNFEQIEHLAELAKKEGLEVLCFTYIHWLYFQRDRQNYTNLGHAFGLPTIPYAQFIAEYEPTYTHEEYMRHIVHVMD
jgi:hypothetical protein